MGEDGREEDVLLLIVAVALSKCNYIKKKVRELEESEAIFSISKGHS